MFNSFLARRCLSQASYPSRSPGCRFLFLSGLWVRGRELVRMELKRRKSAATDPLCSSSSSLHPSTRRTFFVLDFLLLFYSGCFCRREVCRCVESIHACIFRSVLFPFEPLEQLPEIIPFFPVQTRQTICSEQGRRVITKTVL